MNREMRPVLLPLAEMKIAGMPTAGWPPGFAFFAKLIYNVRRVGGGERVPLFVKLRVVVVVVVAGASEIALRRRRRRRKR